MEVEIRACTVTAVEKIKDAFRELHGERPLSIQLDWWLWETAEKLTTLPPHHRVLTMFY